MRRIKKLFYKSVALSLAVILVSGGGIPLSSASAQVIPQIIPDKLPADLAQFKLPPVLGKIDELKPGKDKRVVILIQDAHAIPDAQGSIQKTIAYLREVYGVQHVAVEGTANRLDPTLFRSFPDKVVLKRLFKEYFDRGELTGPSAAALFNSGREIYEGAEDWGVYEQGLALYLSALDNQPGLLEHLKSEKENLEAQKQKVYSEKLSKADVLISRFFLDQSDLLSTLKELARFEGPPEGSDLALMLAEAKREGADQSDIEIEVKKAAEQILSLSRGAKLKAPEQKLFNQRYQDFKTGQMNAQAFAAFLRGFSASNGLKVRFSKALLYSANTQVRLEQVEGTRFFREFKSYAKGIKEHLFENDEQRAVDREAEQIALLERLSLMKLDQEDWQHIASGEISVQNTAFRDALLPAVAFYQNAKKRDEILFQNLIKQMDKAKTNAGIIVAGGFHTEGLARRLKEAGSGFVVIMPGIRDLPAESRYVDQMRGDVSWRKELKVENGKIDLYGAFARYTRDRLLQSEAEGGNSEESNAVHSSPVLLKNWRDQILRDLAAEGRLEQAAQYTRFLDEVVGAQDAEADLKTLWLRSAEKFMGQIRNLKSTNQLNQANIAKLFAPSGMAAAQTANVFGGSLDTQWILLEFGLVVPADVPDLSEAQTLISVGGRILFENKESEEGVLRSEVRLAEVSRYVMGIVDHLAIINKDTPQQGYLDIDDVRAAFEANSIRDEDVIKTKYAITVVFKSKGINWRMTFEEPLKGESRVTFERDGSKYAQSDFKITLSKYDDTKTLDGDRVDALKKILLRHSDVYAEWIGGQSAGFSEKLNAGADINQSVAKKIYAGLEELKDKKKSGDLKADIKKAIQDRWSLMSYRKEANNYGEYGDVRQNLREEDLIRYLAQEFVFLRTNKTNDARIAVDNLTDALNAADAAVDLFLKKPVKIVVPTNPIKNLRGIRPFSEIAANKGVIQFVEQMGSTQRARNMAVLLSKIPFISSRLLMQNFENFLRQKLDALPANQTYEDAVQAVEKSGVEGDEKLLSLLAIELGFGASFRKRISIESILDGQRELFKKLSAYFETRWATNHTGLFGEDYTGFENNPPLDASLNAEWRQAILDNRLTISRDLHTNPQPAFLKDAPGYTESGQKSILLARMMNGTKAGLEKTAHQSIGAYSGEVDLGKYTAEGSVADTYYSHTQSNGSDSPFLYTKTNTLIWQKNHYVVLYEIPVEYLLKNPPVNAESGRAGRDEWAFFNELPQQYNVEVVEVAHGDKAIKSRLAALAGEGAVSSETIARSEMRVGTQKEQGAVVETTGDINLAAVSEFKSSLQSRFAELPLTEQHRLKNYTRIDQLRALLSDIKVESIDKVDSKTMISEFSALELSSDQDYPQYQEMEYSGKSMVAFKNGNDAIAKLIYPTGSMGMVYKNDWRAGIELAHKRLAGLAVNTFLFDAQNGDDSLRFITAAGRTLEGPFTVVQSEVIPLYDFLEDSIKVGRPEDAKAALDEFKEIIVRMYLRGVVDTDIFAILQNYGFEKVTGQLKVFDYGDLRADVEGARDFIGMIDRYNAYIGKLLEAIDGGVVLAEYFAQHMFVKEDFLDREGKDIFARDGAVSEIEGAVSKDRAREMFESRNRDVLAAFRKDIKTKDDFPSLYDSIRISRSEVRNEPGNLGQLSVSELQDIAKASLSVTQAVHDRGIPLLFTSGTGNVAESLFKNAWKRLYPSEALPVMLHFGTVGNIILYKNYAGALARGGQEVEFQNEEQVFEQIRGLFGRAFADSLTEKERVDLLAAPLTQAEKDRLGVHSLQEFAEKIQSKKLTMAYLDEFSLTYFKYNTFMYNLLHAGLDFNYVVLMAPRITGLGSNGIAGHEDFGLAAAYSDFNGTFSDQLNPKDRVAVQIQRVFIHMVSDLMGDVIQKGFEPALIGSDVTHNEELFQEASALSFAASTEQLRNDPRFMQAIRRGVIPPLMKFDKSGTTQSAGQGLILPIALFANERFTLRVELDSKSHFVNLSDIIISDPQLLKRLQRRFAPSLRSEVRSSERDRGRAIFPMTNFPGFSEEEARDAVYKVSEAILSFSEGRKRSVSLHEIRNRILNAYQNSPLRDKVRVVFTTKKISRLMKVLRSRLTGVELKTDPHMGKDMVTIRRKSLLNPRLNVDKFIEKSKENPVVFIGGPSNLVDDYSGAIPLIQSLLARIKAANPNSVIVVGTSGFGHAHLIVQEARRLGLKVFSAIPGNEMVWAGDADGYITAGTDWNNNDYYKAVGEFSDAIFTIDGNRATGREYAAVGNNPDSKAYSLDSTNTPSPELLDAVVQIALSKDKSFEPLQSETLRTLNLLSQKTGSSDLPALERQVRRAFAQFENLKALRDAQQALLNAMKAAHSDVVTEAQAAGINEFSLAAVIAALSSSSSLNLLKAETPENAREQVVFELMRAIHLSRRLDYPPAFGFNANLASQTFDTGPNGITLEDIRKRAAEVQTILFFLKDKPITMIPGLNEALRVAFSEKRLGDLLSQLNDDSEELNRVIEQNRISTDILKLTEIPKAANEFVHFLRKDEVVSAMNQIGEDRLQAAHDIYQMLKSLRDANTAAMIVFKNDNPEIMQKLINAMHEAWLRDELNPRNPEERPYHAVEYSALLHDLIMEQVEKGRVTIDNGKTFLTPDQFQNPELKYKLRLENFVFGTGAGAERARKDFFAQFKKLANEVDFERNAKPVQVNTIAARRDVLLNISGVNRDKRREWLNQLQEASVHAVVGALSNPGTIQRLQSTVAEDRESAVVSLASAISYNFRLFNPDYGANNYLTAKSISSATLDEGVLENLRRDVGSAMSVLTIFHEESGGKLPPVLKETIDLAYQNGLGETLTLLNKGGQPLKSAVEKSSESRDFIGEALKATTETNGARSEVRKGQETDVTRITDVRRVQGLLYGGEGAGNISAREVVPNDLDASRQKIMDALRAMKSFNFKISSGGQGDVQWKKVLKKIASLGLEKRVLRALSLGVDHETGTYAVMPRFDTVERDVGFFTKQKKIEKVLNTKVLKNKGVQDTIKEFQEQDGFVAVLGGGARQGEDSRVHRMSRAIPLAAEKIRIGVGYGGSQLGVMKDIGSRRFEQLAQNGDSYLLLGVGLEGNVVTNPKDYAARLEKKEDVFYVDPNHSHLVTVSVEGKRPEHEDATEAMFEIFNEISKKIPSVAVVFNGGRITLKEIGENIQADRKTIIVNGTGRSADVIYAMIQGGLSDREIIDQGIGGEQTFDIVKWANEIGVRQHPELFQFVGLDEGPEALAVAVQNALKPAKVETKRVSKTSASTKATRRSEVRPSAETGSENAEKFDEEGMYEKLKVLFSDIKAPLEEVQSRLTGILPNDAVFELNQHYFYANRKYIPQVNRFFEMAADYFQRREGAEGNRSVRMLDFNTDNQSIANKNIINSNAPEAIKAIQEKLYQELDASEKEKLFDHWIAQWESSQGFIHVDHHYDLPVLATVSTTVLLTDLFLHLHNRGRQDLLERIQKKSFGIMDHSDADILLAQFVVGNALNKKFLEINGDLLRNTVLYNDYLFTSKSPEARERAMIFYNIVASLERQIARGKVTYGKALELLEGAISYTENMREVYGTEKNLYNAMSESQELIEKPSDSEKEFGKLFFAESKQYWANDRQTIRNILAGGVEKIESETFESLKPGGVYQIGPILFFYGADGDNAELASSAVFRYLQSERPDLLGADVSTIVVTSAQGQDEENNPLRNFKIRTFMDDEGHFLNLSEEFWKSLKQEGFLEAGGRGLAGGLSKSPTPNLKVSKAVSSVVSAVNRAQEQQRLYSIGGILNSILQHGILSADEGRRRGLPEFLRGRDKQVTDITPKALSVFVEILGREVVDPYAGHPEAPDGKYYIDDADFEEMLLIRVRSLLDGSDKTRSPRMILAEREHTELNEEIEAVGRAVVEERLKSGIMILMRSSESVSAWQSKSPEVEAPGSVFGFDVFEPELIQAVFVPRQIYDALKTLGFENSKFVPVDGTQHDDTYDVDLPDWETSMTQFISSQISASSERYTYILHGARLPAASDRAAKSEVRNAPQTDYVLERMQTTALGSDEIGEIAFLLLPPRFRILLPQETLSPSEAAAAVLKGLESTKGENVLKNQIMRFIRSISDPATLSMTADAEAKALITSLERISKDQTYTIGAILPSEQSQMNPEFLSAMVNTLQDRGVIDGLVASGRGAPMSRFVETLRGVVSRITPVPPNRKPLILNDRQIKVPMIFGADEDVIFKIYQVLNESFFPVSASSSKEEDPFIRNYVEVLKVVAAVHTADLMSHHPSLLTNPAELKQKLFERLFVAENQFVNMLKVSAKGIGVDATVARVYLAWKAAEAAAEAA